MNEKKEGQSNKEVTSITTGDTAGQIDGVRNKKGNNVASLLGTRQQPTSHKKIAALFLRSKKIDISHLLFDGIGNPPEGFSWEDEKMIRPGGILDKILDIIELYDADDKLTSIVYTSLDQYQRKRKIIQASCVYSEEGFNTFLSFLGKATDEDSYNISQDCSRYKLISEYFHSITTELTLDGKEGKLYNNRCNRWY